MNNFLRTATFLQDFYRKTSKSETQYYFFDRITFCDEQFYLFFFQIITKCEDKIVQSVYTK